MTTKQLTKKLEKLIAKDVLDFKVRVKMYDIIDEINQLDEVTI